MPRPTGIYVSVPFCRAKCTFCNFASQAFPPERMQAYVERVCKEIHGLPALANDLGCERPDVVDSIYLGGGTPSLLSPSKLQTIFASLREQLQVLPGAEITVEAAPGQISEPLLDAAMQAGVNRISLGVQSFADEEARAVGRLHRGQTCREEIRRLQRAGVPRISVDLIAGLPFQTDATWTDSLQQVSDSGVEHVSVYMLETDGESRLGSEVERLRATSQLTVLGETARYHASAVPGEELCVELYLQACETLGRNGLQQYEISNFARLGAESHHNKRYWTRDPYVGFGLDAHSMLLDAQGGAVRFQNADDLDGYMNGSGPSETLRVSGEQAFEEAVFLGLRLTSGIRAQQLAVVGEPAMLQALLARARELAGAGLMTVTDAHIALTAKGRVLSSSVFGELLAVPA